MSVSQQFIARVFSTYASCKQKNRKIPFTASHGILFDKVYHTIVSVGQEMWRMGWLRYSNTDSNAHCQWITNCTESKFRVNFLWYIYNMCEYATRNSPKIHLKLGFRVILRICNFGVYSLWCWLDIDSCVCVMVWHYDLLLHTLNCSSVIEHVVNKLDLWGKKYSPLWWLSNEFLNYQDDWIQFNIPERGSNCLFLASHCLFIHAYSYVTP